MNFTKEEVNKYADKLLFDLTDEENKMILNEFADIKENMELIANFENIQDIEPLAYPFLVDVKLREDISSESDDIEDVLKNCKAKEGREIEIPKVVN